MSPDLPSTPPLRILLVDDHRILREGLCALLTREPGFAVVGQLGDGDGTLKTVRREPPDLVVLDVHLPDMNGIEVARRILAVFPEVKVIMLTSDHSHESVHEALLAGVSGYVIKENASEELVQAIRAVVAGQLFLCPEVSTDIIASYRRGQLPNIAPPGPPLSTREREVLKLLAGGLRTKEIAERIGISAKTVETYRHRLMEKLQLTSVAELTRYAIREGLIGA